MTGSAAAAEYEERTVSVKILVAPQRKTEAGVIWHSWDRRLWWNGEPNDPEGGTRDDATSSEVSI